MSAAATKRDIARVQKLLGDQALLKTRVVATGIYADIIRAWPVDTGRSRAAWNMSARRPDVSTPADGESFQAPPPPPSLADLRLGDSVYIVNAVEYAAALNDGHSSKMPAGTVEAVAAKWAALGAHVSVAQTGIGS